MVNLGEVDLDLYQLLKQVNYQPSEFHSGRLKHISLPQCNNKQSRAAFETALTGVFSKWSTHACIYDAVYYRLLDNFAINYTHTHTHTLSIYMYV